MSHMTFSFTFRLIQGPPLVIAGGGVPPPYAMSVGDRAVYYLDSDSYQAGWRLVGLAYDVNAWYLDGSSMILGGSFKSVLSTMATVGSGVTYQLTSACSITVAYYTGTDGTGVG